MQLSSLALMAGGGVLIGFLLSLLVVMLLASWLLTRPTRIIQWRLPPVSALTAALPARRNPSA